MKDLESWQPLADVKFTVLHEIEQLKAEARQVLAN